MSATVMTKGGPQRIAECGTETGYRRHKRRHEEPCKPCLHANNESSKRSRSLSRSRDRDALAGARRLPRDAGYGCDWWERAACRRGVDPEQFAHVGSMPSTTHAVVAQTYCRGCPVVQECADYADRNDCYGVWGGSYRNGASIRIRPLFKGAPKRRIA